MHSCFYSDIKKLKWVPGTIFYLPMIWTPCDTTSHCTLYSHEFQGPSSTYLWSELPVVPHYIVLYTPMSSRSHLILTHDLNTLWWHITLYSILPWVQGPFRTYPWSEFPVVPHYIVLYTPMSSRSQLILTHDLNSLWYHITLYSILPWVQGTIQYLPMIWIPCGATFHCTPHSHEFQEPSNTHPWSEFPVVPHYIVLYTPMSSRDHPVLTYDLNSLWCHITLYSTLQRVPGAIQVLTGSAVKDSADVRFRDDLLVHDKQQQHCYTLLPHYNNVNWKHNFNNLIQKCLLQGVNTNHPDFVLSSAGTSIKVIVLLLIYTVYPWFEHCEYALM